MAIEIACPRCAHRVAFPESAVGRKGVCPGCAAVLDIHPGSGRRRPIVYRTSIVPALCIAAAVCLVIAGGAGYAFRGALFPPPPPVVPPPEPPDPGPAPKVLDFDSARAVGFNDLLATVEETLETGKDVDMVRLSAPAAGLLVVKWQIPERDEPEWRVRVYGADRSERPDWPLIRGAGQVGFRVTDKEVFYLQTTSANGKTGTFKLSLEVTKDDFGDTFESAQPTPLSASGNAVIPGTINYPGDVDMFRIEAAASGTVHVQVKPRGADPKGAFVLKVFEGPENRPVPTNKEGEDSPPTWTFAAVKGHVYFLQVEADPGEDGKGSFLTEAYWLDVNLRATPEAKPVQAAEIKLTETGDNPDTTGTIRKGMETTVYRVNPTTAGLMIVRLQRTPTSLFLGTVRVTDAERKPLTATTVEGSAVGEFQTSFTVEKGRACYLEVGAAPGSDPQRLPGEYRLRVNTTRNLLLDPTGSRAFFDGSIGLGEDAEFHRLRAPVTGTMTIRQQMVPSKPFASDLVVYDASMKQVARSTSDPTKTTAENRVDFPVVAGRFYVVKVACPPAQPDNAPPVKRYALLVTTTPRDTEPTPVRQIVLTEEGENTGTTGVFRERGETNRYRVKATQTGEMTVHLMAPPTSNLAGALAAFEETLKPIGRTDSEGALECVLTFPVKEGRTYNLTVTPSGSAPPAFASGAYQLAIKIAPVEENDGVRVILLSPGGRNTTNGRIQRPGEDHDYRFKATVTGTMTVRQQAVGGSRLDSRLMAFDAGRNPLDDNDNEAPTVLDSRVGFRVVAGNTYLLKAAASERARADQAIGDYRLVLSTISSALADLDPKTVQVLEPPASGDKTDYGTIEKPDQVVRYRVTAPADGFLTVRQQPLGASMLHCYLRCYDDKGNLVAENDDERADSRDSRVRFPVVAGRVYTLEAGGSTHELPDFRVGGFKIVISLTRK